MSHRIYNPLIVFVIFVAALIFQVGPRERAEHVAGRHDAVDRFTFSSWGRMLDAPIHDAFFRMRNKFFQQPIAPEITVVGIDDFTVSKLGKFNTGSWSTREPFQYQLRAFAEVFHPAVIAYDIVFKKIDSGGDADYLISEDADRIAGIEKALNSLAKDQISIEDNVVLAAMAQLTKEQGDLNLANALGAVGNSSGDDVHTDVLLAYYFPETTDTRWSTASILGTDPQALAEDAGTELPYMRDVHIPVEAVTGSEAYPWFDYAATLPTNIFLDYGKLAYINVPRDEDGIIRRVPLIMGMRYTFQDPKTAQTVERRIFMPSMSLLSVLYLWGIDLPQLHADDAFFHDGQPVVAVELGKEIRVHRPNGDIEHIPIDGQGRMLLDYVGQVKEFTTVPFAMVNMVDPLAYSPDRWAELPEERQNRMQESKERDLKIKRMLDKQLVMVGLMATGEIDVGPCPINSNTPFVHVHMTAASNILTSTYLRRTTRSMQFWTIVLLGVVLMAAASLLSAMRMTYVAMLTGGGYLAAVFGSVVLHGYQLPLIAPLGAVAISYLILVLVYYLTEEREKRRIRGMFSAMVSGEVLNYMEANPGSFSLGGERRDATIFFSDLAGFTTISENLPADQLVELLNEYLSPMTDIILESQGFVDKYIGDAIMAVWGVPYPNPDHAWLACWAALDQQKKIKELQARFKEHYHVDVLVRMGINSGTIVAGNMGSNARLSYTVMGDAVNQAARYEPANKDYDTLIMIGESTYTLAREHIETRLLDRIVVKGKSVPIQVYELLAKSGELSDEKARIVALYHQGLEVHWMRQWDRALELFREALALDPHDGPSLAMIARIEYYIEHPPPDSWQGEFVRKTK